MKRYHQYKMDFSGKWLGYSGLCMGLSVFLTALYYFGLCNMKDVSLGELLVCLWLPLIFGICYIALLRVVRLNAPGLYGILGAVFSVIFILAGFAGGVGKAIISIPIFAVCALVLLVVVGGFFPAKMPAALVYGIGIVLRVILFDLGRLGLKEWIPEAAVLCGMAAFMFLPLGLKSVNRRKERP